MAKDKVEPIVRVALEKDGWKVEKMPLTLVEEDSRLEIDLQAEKLMVATKDLKRIAIEVKTFGRQSVIYTFHEALGQYFNYLTALDILKEERELYLAVDSEIHKQMLKNVFIRTSLKRYDVKLLIFNVHTSNIEQWID